LRDREEQRQKSRPLGDRDLYSRQSNRTKGKGRKGVKCPKKKRNRNTSKAKNLLTIVWTNRSEGFSENSTAPGSRQFVERGRVRPTLR